MAGLVVSRLGGTSENELTWIDSFVNRSADVIPDPWLELPLVDKSRDVAFQDQSRIHFGSVASSLVNVKQYLAAGDLTGGFGLSTSLSPLDEDRASSPQPFLQLRIRDSPGVFHLASQ
jgi:hypothetical protein